MSITTALGGPKEIIHAVEFKCCAKLQPCAAHFDMNKWMFSSQLTLDPHQLSPLWDRQWFISFDSTPWYFPARWLMRSSTPANTITLLLVLFRSRLTGCIQTYLDQSNFSCHECRTAQIQHSELALKGEVGFQTGKAFEQFMRIQCCTKHTK